MDENITLADDVHEEVNVVEEVIEVVTVAKLIIDAAKVSIAGVQVSAASEPLSAATTKDSAATTTTTATKKVSKVTLAPKKKGVVIEESSESTTIVSLTQSQEKGKGKEILIKEPKALKRKHQLFLDEEEAKRLQVEFDEEERLARDQEEEQEELTDAEKATLFMQLLEKRRKYFATKRAEAKMNKPPTQAQQRKIMCIYLKNMKGYKLSDLKLFDFDVIQKKFDRAYKREKRPGEELEQEHTKKQKLDEDKEQVEHKQLIEIIPDENDVAIDATPLATKYRVIGWKIYKERKNKDNVWRNQEASTGLIWKLYDSCGVHSLWIKSMQIYMLVERRYPLIVPTLRKMLELMLLMFLLVLPVQKLMLLVEVNAARVEVNAAGIYLALLNLTQAKEFDPFKSKDQQWSWLWSMVGGRGHDPWSLVRGLWSMVGGPLWVVVVGGRWLWSWSMVRGMWSVADYLWSMVVAVVVVEVIVFVVVVMVVWSVVVVGGSWSLSWSMSCSMVGGSWSVVGGRLSMVVVVVLGQWASPAFRGLVVFNSQWSAFMVGGSFSGSWSVPWSVVLVHGPVVMVVVDVVVCGRGRWFVDRGWWSVVRGRGRWSLSWSVFGGPWSVFGSEVGSMSGGGCGRRCSMVCVGGPWRGPGSKVVFSESWSVDDGRAVVHGQAVSLGHSSGSVRVSSCVMNVRCRGVWWSVLWSLVVGPIVVVLSCDCSPLFLSPVVLVRGRFRVRGVGVVMSWSVSFAMVLGPSLVVHCGPFFVVDGHGVREVPWTWSLVVRFVGPVAIVGGLVVVEWCAVVVVRGRDSDGPCSVFDHGPWSSGSVSGGLSLTVVVVVVGGLWSKS
ncbi:hypothetical protein Tco_0174334 [Tanacetum coccineum]